MTFRVHALFVSLTFIATAARAAQTIHYVEVNSTNPAPPYTNWAGAARTIQDALNVAGGGDLILVSNGVYGPFTATNSVAIRAVNGAGVTIVDGQGTEICAHFRGSATLSGFTLRHGTAGVYGESTNMNMVSDCVMSGNIVYGGAYHAALSNCLLSANSAYFDGGGASYCILTNCTLRDNSTPAGGGGALSSTLNNCLLIHNSAQGTGGGSAYCRLNNCVLSGNHAGYGGGDAGSDLTNCTITGNSADYSGGANSSSLYNSIVYFNHASIADDNSHSSTMSFCCTTPLPLGTGNISADPLLADSAHLSAASPCRDAGSAAFVSGVDIDGEAWANPPSIGCDEYHAGSVTNSLSVILKASYTQVAAGFEVDLTGQIIGHATDNRWEFGDGAIASNQLAVSHIWLTPGVYQVTLRAYNDSNPAGVTASVSIYVVETPVYYVSAGNTNAIPPYNSWATAAANIQDAVNTASPVPGSQVLVTNGIYTSGGASDALTLAQNRVAVTKALTLRSVNGPAVTIIDGGGWGTNSRRCVFLGHGSALAGFTLTNGGSTNVGSYATVLNGGGVYCADQSGVVSNCVLAGNFAFYGAGTYGGTLNSCVLAGNTARWGGGGAYYADLNNCTLNGNSGEGAIGGQLNRCVLSANTGGGARDATLNDCIITGNSAWYEAGGVSWSTLSRCVLTNNYGSGAYVSTLFNCYIANNSTTNNGGGAYASKLVNCAVIGNSAQKGGGVYDGTLNNCTVVGNSAQYGGGAYSQDGNFNNSIFYHNHASVAGDEYYGGGFNYCCTTPLPPWGTNNITSDPILVDFSHISSASPCRGAGSAALASGVDIDGEAWLNPPSIGCDEYHSGSITGALSVAIQPSYTNVAPGVEVTFSGQVFGHASSNTWDFGDAADLNNRFFVSHSWSAIGDYTVVFRAYNETYPFGVSAGVTVHVLPPPIHYVNGASLHPIAPYTNWATAAATIQDAVDAASFAGAIVLVTNGTYASGAALVSAIDGSNRVAVTKPLSVRSVNGPTATVIQGDSSNTSNEVRCVYLTSGASLSGFTLTNGGASYYGMRGLNVAGAGVRCGSADAVVSNCVLVGNGLYSYGGGGYRGTYQNCMFLTNSGSSAVEQASLSNCVLKGNNVSQAAYQSTLNQCVLSRNSYYGARECALANCILSGNTGGGIYGGFLTNCTLTGNGNIAAGSSTLVHCNVVGNSGFGVDNSKLYNSIVYYNAGGNETQYIYTTNTFNYCCTTPMPTNGMGNITAEPLLADLSHISVGSPCRGAGNAAYSSGTDIDGEAWLNPPSIGCDEYHAGAITGPLNVSITADFTNVRTGFLVNLSAQISGHASSNQWDFADGSTMANRQFTSHSWNTGGDFLVKFHVYNESNPDGITATLTIHVLDHATHYVSLSSTTPVPPFISWATAATNIQDAIDVAYAGGIVLVTNGLYSPIIATNPVVIRTVNGATNTTIDGGGVTNCVRLGGPARLAGFTLTNGIGRYSGGGVYSSSENLVSDCVLVNNTATDGGGGASYTTLSNCWLIGNSAGYQGGGAQSCILYDCVLLGNSVTNGYGEGGGAISSILNNCVLTGNHAWAGGGVDGGDYEPSLLNNCTLTGNWADYGGGAEFAALNNCIVYFNHARIDGDNFHYSTLNFCCTTPLPPGPGNISTDPLLTDSFHLSAESPCRGAGNPAYARGLDIDGEPWLNPPSIGCDEYHAAANIGPLAVSIQADHTEVAAGFAVNFVGQITGHASANWWDFGDGTFTTNRLSAAHSWTAPGTYQVALSAYNETYPTGVTATQTVHVVATPIYYVAASNATPVAPYTNWATAATSIQDAVDVASPLPGVLVLVTNGVYNTGGRWLAAATETNRVAVTNLLTVRSINGPAMTVIDARVGDSAPWRCVYLGSGATLDGFTLTNGGVSSNSWPLLGYGGGVRAETLGAVVTNCVLSGNKASNGAGASGGTLNNCIFIGNSGSYGCGAYFSTLNNCTLIGNSADHYGGGAYVATLNNCVLTGNSSFGGGGASGGTLSQCILSQNVATNEGGGAAYATLLNCILRTNTSSYGGGAFETVLDDCVLIGNSATNYGGGVFNTTYYGTVNNCTVAGNWAQFGGGVCAGFDPGQHQQIPRFNNSILYYNHATNGVGDNYYDISNRDASVHGLFNNCCTTPLPTNGVANITNAPLFVDSAAGDLHLQPNSPCINAGSNSFVSGSTDLDGGPRILGGIVDIGAYEFHPSHAPVADASATHTPLVSANGTNATVILDGSRSSDADGLRLQYTWYEASNFLANGVVVVKVLPLGAHPISLVVSDGFSFSTNAIAVEVLTPAQAVQRLESIVNAAVDHPGPLLAKLDAALAAILQNNSVLAINELKAFQMQLKAQVASADSALAASLTESAQDIIDALSGGNTNPGGHGHAQFTSISFQSDGHVRMQFAGDSGAPYLIESSTNLVDWELIGVASSLTNGQFQFNDKEAGRFARRYYRLRGR